MDNNNWRPNPSQGPVVGGGGGVGGGGVGAPGGGGGEAAMDSVDWRSQLQPDSRQRIVNKIMETLKRHLPVSGQEGLHELRKIAIRFEEKIYTAATSQSDYLRKLSLKMLTMETKSQNPIGNALPSNSAGNSNKSPDAVMRTRRGLCYPRVVEDKNMRVVKQMRDFAAEQVSYQKRSRNSSDIAGKRDLFDALPDDLVISILCKLSSSATCPFDFANVLLTCRRLNGLVPNSLEQPDSRQRIANKIMETLKRHLLVSGQEGLHELRKISIRFEEKVYTAATSQSDYLRKISKMITMETKSQNPIGNALPSNSAGNINMSPDAGSGGGGGVGAPEGGGGEAAMDSVDWQLRPDSRLRIVNKIMETWKRHLPVSGQEGLHELGKIAIMFEEKIYIAATSQSDYLRKLSLKMLTMELYL